MSSSNQGIFTWIRRNPYTSGILFIFFIAIIALLIFFTQRKPRAGNKQSIDGPVIEIMNIKRIINPVNEDETETYKLYGTEFYNIEYASPDVVNVLGKNIDFNIKWKNGAGFGQKKVNKLVFEKLIDGEVVDSVVKNDKNSIIDFGGGEVFFDGDNLSDENAKKMGGKIVFRVKYGIIDSQDLVKIFETSPITIPQSDLDSILLINKVQVTSIDPTIFSGTGFTKDTTVDSYSYTNIKTRISKNGYNKNFRIKENADNTISLILSGTPQELITGVTNYTFEKYLEFFVIRAGDKYVGWDYTDRKFKEFSSREEIFSSTANLTSATWIVENINRRRSIYISSAKYKCGGHPEVDVSKWFKEFIDRVPPGDDLSRYLCSTGGKYEGRCNPGAYYPGSTTVWEDEGLYTAAKAAGSGGMGNNCAETYQHIVITGVNGGSYTWTWGNYLNMTNILTMRSPNSKYIQSAKYKCGGHPEVDVTDWFKIFVDNVSAGDDLSKYLCSTGGKYSISGCNPGAYYPGSTTVWEDEGLYTAAKAAGSEGMDNNCARTYQHIVITGVNGGSYTWTWGNYLDLSNILTTSIPNSVYIQSAKYKCGGYPEVDVTDWLKRFLDSVPAGDDISNYLCSVNGRYEGRCNPGTPYPGSHKVWYDDGLYEAAKAAGSGGMDNNCASTYQHIVITGVNGNTFTWTWGAALNLYDILTGVPIPDSNKKILDSIKAQDAKASSF